MPRGRPVTLHQRARILDLHAKGLGRNEIARLVGVAQPTVTKVVRADGGSFDRAATASATKARVTDLAALRASLSVRLVEKAHGLLDDMDGEFLAFAFGGKDNDYNEHTLPKPPTGDIRNLMQSAAIASKESRELVRFDSDGGAGKAGNLLDALAAGITEAARLLDDDVDAG